MTQQIKLGSILAAAILSMNFNLAYAHDGGTDGDHDGDECPCNMDIKMLVKNFKNALPVGVSLFGACDIHDRVLITQGNKINTVVTARTSKATVGLGTRINDNNFYAFDGSGPSGATPGPTAGYVNIFLSATWNPLGNVSR